MRYHRTSDHTFLWSVMLMCPWVCSLWVFQLRPVTTSLILAKSMFSNNPTLWLQFYCLYFFCFEISLITTQFLSVALIFLTPNHQLLLSPSCPQALPLTYLVTSHVLKKPWKDSCRSYSVPFSIISNRNSKFENPNYFMIPNTWLLLKMENVPHHWTRLDSPSSLRW